MTFAARRWPADYVPGYGARILCSLLDFFLGIVPTCLFFAWIERNSSLPYVGPELGWPWVSLATESVPIRGLWDAGLVFLFGVIHSLTAQSRAQERLKSLVAPQFIRSIYVMLSGMTALAMMGLWQSTGVVFWVLPLAPKALSIISLLIYWSLVGIAFSVINRFDGALFLGFRQLGQTAGQIARPAGNPELVQSGAFARVRHPMYSLTLLAVFAAPFLTLDRFVIGAVIALYLVFAIPLEERKLEDLFGDDYRRYRARVPAVIPRLGKRGPLPSQGPRMRD